MLSFRGVYAGQRGLDSKDAGYLYLGQKFYNSLFCLMLIPNSLSPKPQIQTMSTQSAENLAWTARVVGVYIPNQRRTRQLTTDRGCGSRGAVVHIPKLMARLG